jgi:hypothetical protein
MRLVGRVHAEKFKHSDRRGIGAVMFSESVTGGNLIVGALQFITNVHL